MIKGYLQFSNGSSKVELDPRKGKKWLRVTFTNDSPKRLPEAHTCYGQICCPKYESFDKMKKMLDIAFVFGITGYSFS